MKISNTVRSILKEDGKLRQSVELKIAVKLSRDQVTVSRWFNWNSPEKGEDIRLHTAEAVEVIAECVGLPTSQVLVK